MKLIIHRKEWEVAVLFAERFARDYPDRIGVRNGVGYRWMLDRSFYVYRTKAGSIVVR